MTYLWQMSTIAGPDTAFCLIHWSCHTWTAIDVVRIPIRHGLNIRVGHSSKLCKLRTHVPASEGDEGPLVPHLITVVGCAEDCYTVAIMCYLITLILHLQQQSC